jgi:hypothetical protein
MTICGTDPKREQAKFNLQSTAFSAPFPFLHFSFYVTRHSLRTAVSSPPFAFLLLFIDIGSILTHPERYEKHYTRH